MRDNFWGLCLLWLACKPSSIKPKITNVLEHWRIVLWERAGPVTKGNTPFNIVCNYWEKRDCNTSRDQDASKVPQAATIICIPKILFYGFFITLLGLVAHSRWNCIKRFCSDLFIWGKLNDQCRKNASYDGYRLSYGDEESLVGYHQINGHTI
jgi:hypothetical protein